MNKTRVLLVEDEFPARTVFRGMIEARPDLFELVGEAEDGRDGLEMYRTLKPHVIVTDITMPGMNGLDMLREIESMGDAQPQKIILTCHQDFHYAKQAIQLKAASYLLKDDCLSDPELLTRTMEELTTQMATLDRDRQKQQQMEQQLRSGELELERSLFLEQLRSPAAEAQWLSSLREAGFPERGGSAAAILLELDSGSLRFSLDQLDELKLWQFAGANVLKELLGGYSAHKVISLDKGRFLGLYAAAPELPFVPVNLEHMVQSFHTFLKMNAFALQTVFDRGVGEWGPVLRRLATSSYPFFYSGGRSSTADEGGKRNRFEDVPEPMSRLWTKRLKQALLESRLTDAPLEEERAALYRQSKEQHWQPEQIKALYGRVLLELSRFTAEAERTTNLEVEYRRSLEQCQTFFAVHDTTVACFRQLRELQGDSRSIDASIAELVRRMHEDLSCPYSLEELAASVNYSVPYFSAMFKKTTGESFVVYLTRLRIEKAKLLLLTTDQKTFEIAEAVGFENYRSFNRIFKKETGMTPSDYRRG
ncbi:response regulator transcription factor [Cohnella fermenti]|nr:helix-turn-helix domain-containing protein [Cohnella fermenti]